MMIKNIDVQQRREIVARDATGSFSKQSISWCNWQHTRF